MANTQKINETIDKIIGELQELKSNLNIEESNLKNELEIQIQSQEETLESFEALKKALQTEKWPEAVNPNLICQPDNENDKLERGHGIVELMIEEDLKGLKFLDFGCGEGQSVFVSSEFEPLISVGYDIKNFDTWEKYKKENVIFTSNFQTVVDNGPYDVILIFDVLDHLSGESATDVLNKLRSVLTDKGKIYMRCHPFISRHGTHLYHDLNKAFIHLIFTNEELKQIMPNPRFVEENLEVVYPIKAYKEFIENSNLKIVTQREITSGVEPFFKTPKIAERIITKTKHEKFPEFQMGLDFIDYVVSK